MTHVSRFSESVYILCHSASSRRVSRMFVSVLETWPNDEEVHTETVYLATKWIPVTYRTILVQDMGSNELASYDTSVMLQPRLRPVWFGEGIEKITKKETLKTYVSTLNRWSEATPEATYMSSVYVEPGDSVEPVSCNGTLVNGTADDDPNVMMDDEEFNEYFERSLEL